jgi:isopentenyldiphosphate isomerase
MGMYEFFVYVYVFAYRRGRMAMGEEWERSQIDISVCRQCGKMRISDEPGAVWRVLSSKELEGLTAGGQGIQFSPWACTQCAEENWMVKMR